MVLLVIYTPSFAELPSDMYAKPVANDLAGHQWSFRQGMDFDTVGFMDSQKRGITLYVGLIDVDASKPSSNNESTISATILGETITLHQSCDAPSECNYTAIINPGKKAGRNDFWVQVWVDPKDADMNMYIQWLESLRFEFSG